MVAPRMSIVFAAALLATALGEIEYYRDLGPPEQQQKYYAQAEPDFYYRMDPPPADDGETPFAVPPVDPRYYQQVPAKYELKRELNGRSRLDGGRWLEGNTRLEGQPSNSQLDPQDTYVYYDDKLPFTLGDDFENSFEEPRQHRQNPNLAATKANKVGYAPEVMPEQQSVSQRTNVNPKFNFDRDIPTSLVPTSPRHMHVIQKALKNTPEYNHETNAYLIYMYAMIAGVGAAATIATGAFVIGWYLMRKKSKAALDVEYPAYGITGPNTDVTPSGDRQLAHSAQMYHYQHQKQQIIAMKRPGGVNERNGSVSDAESEDENDEGDYTVYECPGFATTGEMEVKNPLFSDEPTPATPAQQATAQPQPKEK